MAATAITKHQKHKGADQGLAVVTLGLEVYADHDLVVIVDLLLESNAAVGDLALWESALTASTIPPSSSILAKYSYARASIRSVSASTK